MSVYLITGELGTGKTLVCVTKIAEALAAGRRVATNIDLDLGVLMGSRRRYDVLRVPDHPVREDFDALGIGSRDRDEKRFGLLVLDEGGQFLNSREFRDKERAPILEWLRHSRKYRWDVFLIIQDASHLDKQARTGFVEHVVKCKRADRLTIPFVSFWSSLIGLGKVPMPKFHYAIVRYGTAWNAMVVDRWVYGGVGAGRYFRSYDTEQRLVGEVLRDGFGAPVVTADGGAVPAVSLHSVLCPASAPWLKRPSGLREWAYDALCWARGRGGGLRWFADAVGLPASSARCDHVEYLVARSGAFPRRWF